MRPAGSRATRPVPPAVRLDGGSDGFEKSRVRRLQLARAEEQERLLERWANRLLEKQGVRVCDLYADMADGKVLVRLVETLTGQRVHGLDKGKTRLHRIQNIQRCLSILANQQVDVGSISPEHVADGSATSVLSLMWLLMQHYQNSDVATYQEPPLLRKPAEPLKEPLLIWCRTAVHRYAKVKILDFCTSWRSGEAFGALIAYCRPELSDQCLGVHGTLVQKMESLFNIAYAHLGIPKLLDPEDTAEGCAIEEDVIAYVTLIYRYFTRNKSRLKAKDRISKFLQSRIAAENSISRYHQQNSDLLSWLHHKLAYVDSLKHPNSVEEASAQLASLNTCIQIEIPNRLEMKTKLDLIKRTYPAAFSAPTHSTGLSDSDVPSSLSSEIVESNVERLWDNLWQSLLLKKNSLLLVLQRDKKVECLAEKWQRKATVLESWLLKTKAFIQEAQLHSEPIDFSLKRIKSVSCEYLAKERQLEQFERLTQCENGLSHQRYDRLRSLMLEIKSVLDDLLISLESKRDRLQADNFIMAVTSELDRIQAQKMSDDNVSPSDVSCDIQLYRLSTVVAETEALKKHLSLLVPSVLTDSGTCTFAVQRLLCLQTMANEQIKNIHANYAKRSWAEHCVLLRDVLSEKKKLLAALQPVDGRTCGMVQALYRLKAIRTELEANYQVILALRNKQEPEISASWSLVSNNQDESHKELQPENPMPVRHVPGVTEFFQALMQDVEQSIDRVETHIQLDKCDRKGQNLRESLNCLKDQLQALSVVPRDRAEAKSMLIRSDWLSQDIKALKIDINVAQRGYDETSTRLHAQSQTTVQDLSAMAEQVIDLFKGRRPTESINESVQRSLENLSVESQALQDVCQERKNYANNFLIHLERSSVIDILSNILDAEEELLNHVSSFDTAENCARLKRSWSHIIALDEKATSFFSKLNVTHLLPSSTEMDAGNVATRTHTLTNRYEQIHCRRLQLEKVVEHIQWLEDHDNYVQVLLEYIKITTSDLNTVAESLSNQLHADPKLLSRIKRLSLNAPHMAEKVKGCLGNLEKLREQCQDFGAYVNQRMLELHSAWAALDNDINVTSRKYEAARMLKAFSEDSEDELHWIDTFESELSCFHANYSDASGCDITIRVLQQKTFEMNHHNAKVDILIKTGQSLGTVITDASLLSAVKKTSLMLETSRSLLHKKLNIMLKDTRAASARAAYAAREHDCACLLKVCSQALDQDHSKACSGTSLSLEKSRERIRYLESLTAGLNVARTKLDRLKSEVRSSVSDKAMRMQLAALTSSWHKLHSLLNNRKIEARSTAACLVWLDDACQFSTWLDEHEKQLEADSKKRIEINLENSTRRGGDVTINLRYAIGQAWLKKLSDDFSIVIQNAHSMVAAQIKERFAASSNRWHAYCQSRHKGMRLQEHSYHQRLHESKAMELALKIEEWRTLPAVGDNLISASDQRRMRNQLQNAMEEINLYMTQLKNSTVNDQDVEVSLDEKKSALLPSLLSKAKKKAKLIMDDIRTKQEMLKLATKWMHFRDAAKAECETLKNIQRAISDTESDSVTFAALKLRKHNVLVASLSTREKNVKALVLKGHHLVRLAAMSKWHSQIAELCHSVKDSWNGLMTTSSKVGKYLELTSRLEDYHALSEDQIQWLTAICVWLETSEAASNIEEVIHLRNSIVLFEHDIPGRANLVGEMKATAEHLFRQFEPLHTSDHYTPDPRAKQTEMEKLLLAAQTVMRRKISECQIAEFAHVHEETVFNIEQAVTSTLQYFSSPNLNIESYDTYICKLEEYQTSRSIQLRCTSNLDYLSNLVSEVAGITSSAIGSTFSSWLERARLQVHSFDVLLEERKLAIRNAEQSLIADSDLKAMETRLNIALDVLRDASPAFQQLDGAELNRSLCLWVCALDDHLYEVKAEEALRKVKNMKLYHTSSSLMTNIGQLEKSVALKISALKDAIESLRNVYTFQKEYLVLSSNASFLVSWMIDMDNRIQDLLQETKTTPVITCLEKELIKVQAFLVEKDDTICKALAMTSEKGLVKVNSELSSRYNLLKNNWSTAHKECSQRIGHSRWTEKLRALHLKFDRLQGILVRGASQEFTLEAIVTLQRECSYASRFFDQLQKEINDMPLAASEFWPIHDNQATGEERILQDLRDKQRRLQQLLGKQKKLLTSQEKYLIFKMDFSNVEQWLTGRLKLLTVHSQVTRWEEVILKVEQLLTLLPVYDEAAARESLLLNVKKRCERYVERNHEDACAMQLQLSRLLYDWKKMVQGKTSTRQLLNETRALAFFHNMVRLVDRWITKQQHALDFDIEEINIDKCKAALRELKRDDSFGLLASYAFEALHAMKKVLLRMHSVSSEDITVAIKGVTERWQETDRRTTVYNQKLEQAEQLFDACERLAGATCQTDAMVDVKASEELMAKLQGAPMSARKALQDAIQHLLERSKNANDACLTVKALREWKERTNALRADARQELQWVLHAERYLDCTVSACVSLREAERQLIEHQQLQEQTVERKMRLSRLEELRLSINSGSDSTYPVPELETSDLQNQLVARYCTLQQRLEDRLVKAELQVKALLFDTKIFKLICEINSVDILFELAEALQYSESKLIDALADDLIETSKSTHWELSSLCRSIHLDDTAELVPYDSMFSYLESVIAQHELAFKQAAIVRAASFTKTAKREDALVVEQWINFKQKVYTELKVTLPSSYEPMEEAGLRSRILEAELRSPVPTQLLQEWQNLESLQQGIFEIANDSTHKIVEMLRRWQQLESAASLQRQQWEEAAESTRLVAALNIFMDWSKRACLQMISAADYMSQATRQEQVVMTVKQRYDNWAFKETEMHIEASKQWWTSLKSKVKRPQADLTMTSCELPRVLAEAASMHQQLLDAHKSQAKGLELVAMYHGIMESFSHEVSWAKATNQTIVAETSASSMLELRMYLKSKSVACELECHRQLLAQLFSRAETFLKEVKAECPSSDLESESKVADYAEHSSKAGVDNSCLFDAGNGLLDLLEGLSSYLLTVRNAADENLKKAQEVLVRMPEADAIQAELDEADDWLRSAQSQLDGIDAHSSMMHLEILYSVVIKWSERLDSIHKQIAKHTSDDIASTKTFQMRADLLHARYDCIVDALSKKKESSKLFYNYKNFREEAESCIEWMKDLQERIRDQDEIILNFEPAMGIEELHRNIGVYIEQLSTTIKDLVTEGTQLTGNLEEAECIDNINQLCIQLNSTYADLTVAAHERRNSIEEAMKIQSLQDEVAFTLKWMKLKMQHLHELEQQLPLLEPKTIQIHVAAFKYDIDHVSAVYDNVKKKAYLITTGDHTAFEIVEKIIEPLREEHESLEVACGRFYQLLEQMKPSTDFTSECLNARAMSTLIVDKAKVLATKCSTATDEKLLSIYARQMSISFLTERLSEFLRRLLSAKDLEEASSEYVNRLQVHRSEEPTHALADAAAACRSNESLISSRYLQMISLDLMGKLESRLYEGEMILCDVDPSVITKELPEYESEKFQHLEEEVRALDAEVQELTELESSVGFSDIMKFIALRSWLLERNCHNDATLRLSSIAAQGGNEMQNDDAELEVAAEIIHSNSLVGNDTEVTTLQKLEDQEEASTAATDEHQETAIGCCLALDPLQYTETSSSESIVQHYNDERAVLQELDTESKTLQSDSESEIGAGVATATANLDMQSISSTEDWPVDRAGASNDESDDSVNDLRGACGGGPALDPPIEFMYDALPEASHSAYGQGRIPSPHACEDKAGLDAEEFDNGFGLDVDKKTEKYSDAHCSEMKFKFTATHGRDEDEILGDEPTGITVQKLSPSEIRSEKDQSDVHTDKEKSLKRRLIKLFRRKKK